MSTFFFYLDMIVLTLYIPVDEFLIQNCSYFTNIKILQTKLYLFINLFMGINYLIIINLLFDKVKSII
jgi:hypothetical protein